jgi:hypothetical protein
MVKTVKLLDITDNENQSRVEMWMRWHRIILLYMYVETMYNPKLDAVH